MVSHCMIHWRWEGWAVIGDESLFLEYDFLVCTRLLKTKKDVKWSDRLEKISDELEARQEVVYIYERGSFNRNLYVIDEEPVEAERDLENIYASKPDAGAYR